MATGTIFDSPWFAFERPAFERILRWSDPAVTVGLLAIAAGLIWLALSDRTTTKAVVFAWCVLP